MVRQTRQLQPRDVRFQREEFRLEGRGRVHDRRGRVRDRQRFRRRRCQRDDLLHDPGRERRRHRGSRLRRRRAGAPRL